MSESTNTPVETVTDDLDAFSEQLFGQSAPPEEAATSEEEAQEVQTDDANNETVDTQTTEDDDTLAPEDLEHEETEATPEEKPKKNRYQERIDELTAKYREAERQREADRVAFEARLKSLESPTKTEELPNTGGPTPDEKLENGRDKYPLGEYDPAYVRDLARFEVKQEMQVHEKAREEAERTKAQDAQLTALHESWNQKLSPAQERYPDFVQKSQDLLESFNDLDSTYEDYLSATIMGMDYGPDVLYYLASNPAEATSIFRSGATKATIALGRLEARFAEAEAEKTLTRPKVSQAPVPPPTVRGAAPAKMPTAPDTDDLDAFERELFKKKR